MTYVEEYRASRMGATSETVDISPGPGFVAPVMALDSLELIPHEKAEPIIVVGYLDPMGYLCVSDDDEKTIASAMDFYYKSWPKDLWPNYTLMEVHT